MKNILIVEGNLREENQSFSKVGIQTHTESLKDSLAYFTNELNFDVVNPSSDQNIQLISDKLENYDGLIWGGSSLNIYDDTPEIKKQIEFMKDCQKKVKKILAICWGMQVAVTAAGGQVKKANNSHIGIANEIEVNENGISHPLYDNKDRKFNSPAFNFDEVAKLPKNSKLLASNPINKVMGVNFQSEVSDIWGIQYHPEITYDKMISLIHFRKERLLNNNAFVDEQEINNHVRMIAEENKITNKDLRMRELENWLNYLLK